MKRLIALLLAVLMLCLAGCGGKDSGADVQMDVQAVYDSMVPVLPEMLPMDEMMMLNFCGIEASMCEKAVVSVCFDGLRADEIWLIEAKDAASLENLKNLAQSRLNRKGEEVELTGTELLARAICHECDHLDGKLFTDVQIRPLDEEDK